MLQAFPWIRFSLQGPTAAEPGRPSLTTWALLGACTLGLSVGFMTLIPCNNALLAQAADPAIQGLTQGTAQSAGALSRSAGPVLVGLLYALRYARPPARSSVRLGRHSRQGAV